MYTEVHNIIAKTMNSFYKALISMPTPWAAFLFENPVQHIPVLSQFSIYTLYDTHTLRISGSSIPRIFVFACAWGVVDLRYCSGISETVFIYNPPV
jgi:hypothetical protein